MGNRRPTAAAAARQYHDRSSLSARGSLAVRRAARNGFARSRSLR
jgi:hypothetical protein